MIEIIDTLTENKEVAKLAGLSKRLRMAARITGTIWAAVIIFFFVGTVLEGIHKNAGLPSKPYDKFGIAAVLSLGIAVAGLVIGLWKNLKCQSFPHNKPEPEF